MMRSQRLRLARPVVLVYWLMVLGGLVLFSAGRLQHADRLTPLWIGALAGTALGQFLALHNLRLWLTVLILITLAYFSMPLTTSSVDVLALWKVLVPAVLCGYWSLGDRAIATAFWFPTVLWMLSILDRTQVGAARGQLVPDAVGGVLLVALGLAFFLFLRVRESRRVGLWSTVAAQPLAAARPVSRRSAPSQQVLRTGWSVAVTASTALLTAWLAPRLWQLESLRGEHQRIASSVTAVGLPCCPSARVAEMQRARVREYLDLGIGHDEGVLVAGAHGPSCQVCDDYQSDDTYVSGTLASNVRALGRELDIDGVGLDGSPGAGRGGGGGVGGGISGGGGVVDLNEVSEHPGSSAVVTTVPPPASPAFASPAPLAPVPPPAALPPPPKHDTPPPAPRAAVPASVPHTSAVSDPSVTVSDPPIHRGSPPSPAFWQWLAVLALAALVMQAVSLALRPLRRLVLLRHLRNPLWPETIDQRISNAWQLALIGLGDAGWHPDSTEAPRELAARASIDGIERCAVILERARHGLGIDAGDLSDMQSSAVAAYHSARTRLSSLARALSWLRWPLA